nr:glycine--tRNA ligase [Spirochaetota bacterium]
MSKVTMEKIVSLCKRRGFIYQSSEIYGGLSGAWDYGPLGVELKNRIRDFWWREMTQLHDSIVGLDAAIMMHPKVWEASGHVANFSDPMVDCRKCNSRFRSDHIDLAAACPVCGSKETFTEPREFNLMFSTHLGPVKDDTSIVYLRPETAQGIFVNFKNVIQTSRVKIPFGI